MKKIKENAESVRYVVNENSDQEFYVQINTETSVVDFSYNHNFDSIKMIFPLNKEKNNEQKGNLDKISTEIIGKVLYKIQTALEKQEFPDTMGYISH